MFRADILAELSTTDTCTIIPAHRRVVLAGQRIVLGSRMLLSLSGCSDISTR